MTEIGLIEPGDLSFVRTGESWPFKFWYRDDQTARDNDFTKERRWWDVCDECGDNSPVSWDHVAALTYPQLVKFAPLRRSAEETTEAKP